MAIDDQSTSPPALYARFARRLTALVLDAGLIIGWLVLVAFLAGFVRLPPWATSVTFVVAVVAAILYEPILVSLTGRTLGHRAMNLRVVTDSASGRLPFWRALLRWLLKAITGISAFATMPATRRNQAIHDLVFRTTVQIADEDRALEHHYIHERPTAVGGPLPTRGRRVAVIVGYALLLFVVMTIASAVVVSAECLDYNACTPGENLWGTVLGTAWIAATALTSVLGWQGRLWGCRRRPITASVGPPSGGQAA